MTIQLPDISCTGCGACLRICTQGAISLESQEDGFLYPVIHAQKCVSCGLCMRACHALGNVTLHRANMCYAAQLKEKEPLDRSTSGGLFYALASHILEEHGVVYGCVFDGHYDAVIVRAETPEQLLPMHGSKYVWSDSSQSFPRVREDLESGRAVLYTSLPCQAAGLRGFLGKPYDNLFVVDVLCGGGPSPYAFQRYLETLTDETGKMELHFQFRDKEGYGSGVNCTYFRNGKKHHENYLENSFYYAFSSKSRITWRKSCYGCNYKSVSRVSDLSIGDYWGVENHHRNFRARDGVSLILVNTEKGAGLFEKISHCLRFEESNLTYAVEKNSLVNEIEQGHIAVPGGRARFFAVLREKGWKEAEKSFLRRRKLLLLRQHIGKLLRKCKGK